MDRIWSMDRHYIDDERDDFANVPPQILRDIEAGLDDIRHGRTEPGDVVLAALDARIKAWEAEHSLMDRDGESCADGPASD